MERAEIEDSAGALEANGLNLAVRERPRFDEPGANRSPGVRIGDRVLDPAHVHEPDGLADVHRDDLRLVEVLAEPNRQGLARDGAPRGSGGTADGQAERYNCRNAERSELHSTI